MSIAKENEKIEKEKERIKQEEFISFIRSASPHEPVVGKVLGGSGWKFTKGDWGFISCRADCLALSNMLTQEEVCIPYTRLVGLEVTGPGKESSNAGLMGGGFGVAGAIQGILVASVVNMLTTSTRTNTFLRISTSDAEVHLHMSTLEPSELRLLMSPAFVQMESNNRNQIIIKNKYERLLSDEFEKLHQLFRDGVLTDVEFSSAKKQLLKNDEMA